MKTEHWNSLVSQNTRIKSMVNIYRHKAEDIRKNSRLSPSAMKDDLAKLQKDLAEAVLKESSQDATKLITDMRKQLNAEINRKPKSDVFEDLRSELRQQRLWSNLRPLVERAFDSESGPDPLTLVQQLARQANESRDHDLLSVLRNDLPYAFRNSRLAIGIDGADRLEQQIQTLIESESEDMAPEWVKQAKEDLRTLEQAESLFNLNLHEVRKSLDESNLTGDVVFSELTGETSTLVGERGAMTVITGRTAHSGKVRLNQWQQGYAQQGHGVTVSDTPPEHGGE